MNDSRQPADLGDVREWAGLWRLPDDPDGGVPGILRYDGAGGLSLSLIGTLEDRIMSNPSPGVTTFREGRRARDVIHGVAEWRDHSHRLRPHRRDADFFRAG